MSMDTDQIVSAIKDRFGREGWDNLIIDKRPNEAGDYDEVFWVGVHSVTRVVDDKEVHPAVIVRVDGDERLRNLSRIELLWLMKIDQAARSLRGLLARVDN